jgi:hypothetical protein
MGKKAVIWLIIVIVIVVGGYIIFSGEKVGAGTEAIIYKSPNCGCCEGHAEYLRQNGFDVTVVPINDMQSVKDKHNIPAYMESCHTSVIGDYFVEGHVPVEAISKLLEERTDVDGIALPRMPSGSPGMPGPKREVFNIQGLKGGEVSDFMKI